MYRKPRTARLRPDKPFRYGVLFIGVIIVALVAATLLVNNESRNFFSALVPETEETPDAQPTDSSVKVVNTDENMPAYTFMQKVLDSPPSNFGKNIVDSAGTPNNALSWVCGYEISPAPVLSNSVNFPRKDATVVIQALGAGQSASAIDHAYASVANCDNNAGHGGIVSSASPIDGTKGFSGYYKAGSSRQTVFVWQRGDVVMSVASPSLSTTSKLAGAYDSLLVQHLKNVCLALDVEDEDAGRSPFYNAQAYTGWNRGRLIELNTKVPGLAAGMLSTSSDISGDGLPQGDFYKGLSYPVMNADPKVPSWSVVALPERPLEPVPTSLPSAVDEPGARPTAPSAPEKETTIPERVEDPKGPGCGWAFTSQESPVWDASAEKERADKEAAKAQRSLRDSFFNYLNEDAEYVNAWTGYYQKVKAYNTYADKVDKVAAEWAELNAIRAEYRARLDAYWASVNAREDFKDRKQAAQEAYDDLVDECEAFYEEAERAAKEKEEEPSPSPSENNDQKEPSPEPSKKPTASPTPEPTPEPEPEPEPTPTIQCPPDRPAILDQDPPSVLPIPDKPNVPLPHAWDDIPG